MRTVTYEATESQFMPGNEPDQPPTDTESPPADTFALVGHEIRAEIIQVLGQGHYVQGPGDKLSLSDLRSRLDTDVEPSQLHYHLQQLVGHFVEQTDDGYQLNSVGTRLSWTLRAGSLDRREEHMTVAANFDCYYCGALVETVFAKGSARMGCPECGQVYMTDNCALPLSAFADEEAAFLHFSQYMVLRILSLSRGVCPSCANSLTRELYSLDEDRNRNVEIDLSCDGCGSSWWQTVGMSLIADSELIAFCYDHSIDILSIPHWELEFAATDKHVTVRSTDPWEVALEVTFDGDTLELVVDGDLNVIERNRLDAATVDEGGLPETGACFQALRRHRWPNGVTCPHCDGTDTIRKGTTSKDAQRYRCHGCGSTFNDLTATIFAEHRLSLPEMFFIIRHMDEVEMAEIARELDRPYNSIMDFVHTVEDSQREGIDVDPSEFCESMEFT